MVCLASWICSLMYFINFGKFFAILSSNILTIRPSSQTPILLDGVPQLCLIFFIIFSFCFRLKDLNWPIFKFTDSSSKTAQIWYWARPLDFSFQSMYFSIPEFLFSSFLKIISFSLLDITYLMRHYCHTFLELFRHGFLSFFEHI